MKTKNLFLLPALISFLSYTANAQSLTANFSYSSISTCSSSRYFTNLTTGGTAPYTYQWDFGDGITSTQQSPSHIYSSLGNFNVRLSVIDSNQNTDSSMQSVTISALSSSVASDISCYGACDGLIFYSTTAMYTLLWSDGSTLPYLGGLCPGTYSVTITDTSGSSCSDTFNISEPPQLSVTQSTITGTCLGNNGSIDVTVSGGTSPYFYQWSNGASTEDLSGLAAGNYSLTFMDNNQCVNYTIITVDGNTLGLSFSMAHANCGAADGAVTVHPIGGSGVYSFQWSPVAGTDSMLSGLYSGTYYVTVTDTNGCVGMDSVSVTDSCGVVSGHVFDDLNKNGVKDVGENGIAGITIYSNGAPAAVTNQIGNYYFSVPAFDTFYVEVSPITRYYCSGTLTLPDSVTAPPGNLYTAIVTLPSPSSSGNDFGIATHANPCGTISGYVFDDLNGNGTDDGEPRKSGVTVRLSTGQYAVTNLLGMYSVEVPLNVAVTVSISPAPGSYFCGAHQPYYIQTFPPFSGNYSVTLTSGSPSSTGNDFGVQQTAVSYDVGIYSVRCFSGIHAGRTFTAWTDFKASGTITDTCKLRLTYNPLVSFVSASITPATITGTYVEWAFPPGTAPSAYCMEMTFSLDSSATAGTQLIWTEVYYCGSPDGCPGNDTLTVVNTVQTGPLRREQVNGFNYMEVEHTGTAAGSLTMADSVFSYMIMFQNTGTDTAYHLTIIDTLSPNLNIKTVSFPFSSHSFQLNIPASNILIWEFNNILLPDSSTDYLHSYGFVQYNIHMNPNLSPGTRIEHRAAISTNYGNPYLTNETSLIIKEPDDTTGIENLGDNVVKIYPNPGTGLFTIEVSKDFENATRIRVLDLLGATVVDKQIQGQSKSELNLCKLPDGLYLVKLETENFTQIRKIILTR